jgi:hypothetical protein
LHERLACEGSATSEHWKLFSRDSGRLSVELLCVISQHGIKWDWLVDQISPSFEAFSRNIDRVVIGQLCALLLSVVHAHISVLDRK